MAGMLATAGVALGAALVVLLRHARIAPGAYPWIAALGTVLITVGIHFRGTPTAAHALFYLWVILFSGYFLSRRATLAQVALAVGRLRRRRSDARRTGPTMRPRSGC